MNFRKPRVEDGAKLRELVANSQEMDDNSCYLYLLLCQDFADTCVVAESNETIVGFVTGYTPPQRPTSLFVWQVVVAPEARRQGLAKRMLDVLIQQFPGEKLEFVEATITPDNVPSRSLFNALARSLHTEINYTPYFRADHFGNFAHDPEELCRVGPIGPKREKA
ncbi:diaminobutyrate acetyltransferase [Bremerella cremea]|uniref:L-2,4-diaminobutyric acid acetyltransferase n=1 Tax=Bremerella cremea TaxID=1031537 RepID=A0A368KNS9_9BACT|nr:diaminobutyrate acetyltransferase [Bremerella cremea]RCS46102.1 diaminobutyrate acetyltransferase [Bremerella cremea]